MHLIHRINKTSDDNDLKLVSFYTEGTNGDLKTCQSFQFSSQQLRQEFG